MATTGHLTAALAAAMAGLAPAGPVADTEAGDGPSREGRVGDDAVVLPIARRGTVALVQAAALRRPVATVGYEPWRLRVRGVRSAA